MWRTFAALVLLSGPAFGGSFESGNTLLPKCKGTGENYCLGYVAGVQDMFSDMQDTPFCMPPNITVGQITDVFILHLEENPSKRHYTANSLFFNAMNDAFPCD